MQYEGIFELLQKLDLVIYAIHDVINNFSFLCPFESGKNGKGKNNKNLNISSINDISS